MNLMSLLVFCESHVVALLGLCYSSELCARDACAVRRRVEVL